MTKSQLVRDIIRSYEHDWEAEGGAISKRRLWYILKPQFRAFPSYFIGNDEYIEDMYHHGKPVKVITAEDYSRHFNDLAQRGEIDDTFIADNSRVMKVGASLPKIIIAVEKSTVDTAVLNLADKLGCSCYIAKGFSSIYAAKKLLGMVSIPEETYSFSGEIDPYDDDTGLRYSSFIPEQADTPVIVLNMTDHDKSGKEISDTIGRHFDACEVHRVLLHRDQVPEGMEDEFFTQSDKLVGRAYELDILNVNQLVDLFLDNIPAHVAGMITEKYRHDVWMTDGDERIPQMIEDDPEVLEANREIEEIEKRIEEVERPFQEQIDLLTEAMKRASAPLTEHLEAKLMNVDALRLEVLPKHRDNFIRNGNYVRPVTVHELFAS